MKSETRNFFDEVYNATYKSTAKYVAVKCDDISQINDILQEVYIEIYKVIEKRGAKYIENPKAFVRQIAKLKLSKYYSDNKEKQFISIDASEEYEHQQITIADSMNIEEQYITDELLVKISQFIKKQEPQTGKIFYLYYYCDNTIEEIAERLSMKSSTVKTKLYRALAKVRKLYGKEYSENE